VFSDLLSGILHLNHGILDMAAPESVTLQNLSGRWTLNKSQSSDFASVLELQGVNKLIRTAASAASVHVTITQPDEQHISIKQSVTAGRIPGTTEEYVLDWEWRENDDSFYGKVRGRSRWVDLEQAMATGIVEVGEGQSQWLWVKGGGPSKLVQAEGGSLDGEWEAWHLWGFEKVDEERKHTRRVWVKNSKGEELRVRMVYDWVGE
jgi:hypothetical protein